jgi:hypothetical protein
MEEIFILFSTPNLTANGLLYYICIIICILTKYALIPLSGLKAIQKNQHIGKAFKWVYMSIAALFLIASLIAGIVWMVKDGSFVKIWQYPPVYDWLATFVLGVYGNVCVFIIPDE